MTHVIVPIGTNGGEWQKLRVHAQVLAQVGAKG